jgi:hypothetical protein
MEVPVFSLVIALSLLFVGVAVVVAEYIVIGWMRLKYESRIGDATGLDERVSKKLRSGWRITDGVNPFIAVDRSE